MTERFAIYYAPDPTSEFWHLGCHWLGWDAVANAPIEQFVPKGYQSGIFEGLTASPRNYGFHATLKAPMRLAPGVTEAMLLSAAERFASRRAAVDMGKLEVSDIAGFLAIIPPEANSALSQFAAECVCQFEPQRALLNEEEREKRLKSRLSVRQAELLDQYGYPYVMEEFRFHMTLTERLDPAIRFELLDIAKAHFEPVLSKPVTLDRISVYRQPSKGARFERLADFPLRTE